MTNYEKHREKLLSDPEIRAEYEELLPELALVRQLIQARNELNITQKELAEKVGLDQSHIARLESGRYNPSLQFLKKVANGLDKTLYIEFR